MQHLVRATRLVSLTLTICLLLSFAPLAIAGDDGTVYVMSNSATGNSILVFHRASNGKLQQIQNISTQGIGTGFTLDALQSQGALALSDDGSLLLSVNSGSGDFTAFVVDINGSLKFGSKASSGGAFPVSVTVHDHVVYVLNQLGIANIVGFSVDDAGQLTKIPGSSRSLAGKALALPAQVSFTPDGGHLLVTEKGTDLIDIFAVHPDGTVSDPTTKKSVAHTPFGFAFGPDESVIVSNAERRLPLQATTSSYRVSGDSLVTVSARVLDHETAACWDVVTGQTAWIVNTISSAVSAYHIGNNGHLTLIHAAAATTGDDATPIDLAATPDGHFLYVLKSASGSIAGYSINGAELTPLFVKTGLPLSIQGIVAR